MISTNIELVVKAFFYLIYPHLTKRVNIKYISISKSPDAHIPKHSHHHLKSINPELRRTRKQNTLNPFPNHAPPRTRPITHPFLQENIHVMQAKGDSPLSPSPKHAPYHRRTSRPCRQRMPRWPLDVATWNNVATSLAMYAAATCLK